MNIGLNRDGVVDKMIKDQTDHIGHGLNSEGGTETIENVEQQISMVKYRSNTLTENLMEKICDRANLNRAYKRVKANKGAPGIDQLTVEELGDYLRQHKEQLIQSLLDGSYQPQEVRGVKIPKPGGERQLGIPTTVDRLVQQAIHQVLEPIYEPEFSDSSYGFRPFRSTHQALRRAQAYVSEGYKYVVDIDLEKFFDKVNHDILMSRLARKIEDKRLLKIIRRFLQAGLMQDGLTTARHEGMPQGGPLSPLMSNVLLDELDKELERRGHKFCRFADDMNTYVKSEKAGKRVYESIKAFLTKKLKLKVNDQKSAVALVNERKFLGYRILRDGRLTVSPEALSRMKDKVRHLTKRTQGRSFEEVIEKLNTYLQGWTGYFRLSTSKRLWQDLDGWIRRRLRSFRLRQRKRGSSIAKMLMSMGISEKEARQIGSSGKGEWRLSLTRAVHRALDNAWFASQGLISIEARWAQLLNT
jgi:RNA-directed DNA polymerase